MNLDVFDIVVELDVMCVNGIIFGLFYGIFILIKDNIVIVDKMNNIVGFFVLVGVKVFYDSIMVVKLCVVGVIIFGKVNFS